MCTRRSWLTTTLGTTRRAHATHGRTHTSDHLPTGHAAAHGTARSTHAAAHRAARHHAHATAHGSTGRTAPRGTHATTHGATGHAHATAWSASATGHLPTRRRRGSSHGLLRLPGLTAGGAITGLSHLTSARSTRTLTTRHGGWTCTWGFAGRHAWDRTWRRAWRSARRRTRWGASRLTAGDLRWRTTRFSDCWNWIRGCNGHPRYSKERQHGCPLGCFIHVHLTKYLSITSNLKFSKQLIWHQAMCC